MGYYIMQAAPDKDLYIQMSTVIDLPLRLGTMEQWEELLSTMEGKELEAYQGMMERMKEYGSSSWSGNGRWDDDILLVSQGHPLHGDYWLLPRRSVFDFFTEYLEDMESKTFWHQLLDKYCSPLEG